MKIAIITITQEAQNMASSLKKDLDNDPTVFKVDIFHKDVKNTLNKVFSQYECIIGIMATGIIVRNICTLIKDKIHDPAVLVIDDNGKHVISLLSGHLGGANDMVVKIAEIIGAEPVITTATDTHDKLGIDSLARKYYLQIDEPANIRVVNSALVNNKIPNLYVPSRFTHILDDQVVKKSYKCFKSLNNLFKISFRDVDINLNPQKFVMGIGARKDISKDEVLNSIKKAMNILNLPVERIDTIATAEIKKDEVGIVESAKDLQIPLEIISLDKLKKMRQG